MWGITLFPFYFDIWPNKPLFVIKKFWKYLGIFVDLFVGPSRFVLFFFFAFCIFSAMCPICGPLLLNAKFVVQHFFYFHLKRANNNKRVNNKGWHRKILLQIQFFVKLVTDGRFRNIVFFLGLCNIYQRQSWKYS